MILPALAHSLVALWLALYGVNLSALLLLYLRHRNEKVATPTVSRSELPAVVVQVPVYNEQHVVKRVIDSVASLDYPADRLQIQILDDSTDSTTWLARQSAIRHRQNGIDIAVLRRDDRSGYKAGALARGLSQTTADLVAIFDADFRPHPDFLLKTVPHFVARPRLGIVQARWAYLNTTYSPITRAQAIGLDGHFVVEQIGRSRSGLLFNFNGSGGVWRRQCIEESGGWTGDTITEDLDLSYRAQLAGWECLYLPDVEAPAELPPQVAAFKRQQARWAQGSMQTLRKLAPRIVRSRLLTTGQKVMALLHLSAYVGQALTVPLLLLSLPLAVFPSPFGLVLNGLGLVSIGPLLVYAVGQRHLHSDWVHRLSALPLLALLGLGIAWETARAVYRGLTRWGGAFERTPKYRLEGRTGGWVNSGYSFDSTGSLVGEIALAALALGGAVLAGRAGAWGMVPFQLFFAAAFSTTAGLELLQSLAARRSVTPGRAATVKPLSGRRSGRST